MRRFPARPLAAALMLATLALPSAPARAQAPPVTEDGAKALAAALKDGLARWFPKGKDGASEMRWTGDPVATPAGDHYEVALPALTAVSDDGTTADIGTIRLTVKPQGGNTHAVTATLPDRVTVLNKGKPSATISLGGQRLAGVWSDAHNRILSIDGELRDLSVVSDEKDGKGKKKEESLTIGTVTMTGELKPDGTSAAGSPTWSGPGALTLGNIRMTDEAKKPVLELSGFTLEGNYSRVDLARSDALERLAQTHAKAGTEPSVAELLPLVRGLVAGGGYRIALNGLSATNPQDNTRIGIGQFVLHGAMQDLDKPMASSSFGFQAAGLSLEPELAPKSFMPEKLDLQFSIANVPTDSVWRAFADLAALAEKKAAEEESEEESDGVTKGVIAGKSEEEYEEADLSDEEDGEESAGALFDDPELLAIGNRLMGAMAAVGTELRVDRFLINTPATSGSITGALRMAANAAFGTVGGYTMELTGLDTAAKAMQPKPGKKADEETQQALGVIAMLQAMGQASKDAAGKDVRTYKIDVTESGQLLLNGADMSALMGMGGTAPDSAPAPAAKKP